MNTHITLRSDAKMTIDEFESFLDERPEWERWELIEGIAVMSPSPVDFHQLIVTNICRSLLDRRDALEATWMPLAGTNTRVGLAGTSLPIPDVMVRETPLTGSHIADESLAMFEVLSPSNSLQDQDWRRAAYASIPNCAHVILVRHDTCDVTAYHRASNWELTRCNVLGDAVPLEALGTDLPLADIYRYISFDNAT